MLDTAADDDNDDHDDWNDVVVLLANTPWDGPQLGAQPLAQAFARRVPLLYVDPPRSIIKTRRGPRLSTPEPRLARLRTVAPPLRSRAGLRTLTSALSRRELEAAVRHLGTEVRSMLAGPWRGAPYDCCNPRTTLYRVTDDFTAGAHLSGRPDGRTGDDELRLAEAADAIVCVSPPLVAKWRALGFSPSLIPNGCDAEHFAPAPGLARPAEIDLPDPIACFVGQLSTRIDFDLLRAITRRGISLLLVGRARTDLDLAEIEDLLDHPRVQWIDGRPWAEMPAYLGAASVGLVPYRLDEFNRASFPLKLLEYLAAGRHVVSTGLPIVDWLATEHVTVADDPDAFADEVARRVTMDDDPEVEASRLRVARAHTWEARVDDYLRLLDDLEQR